MIQYLFGIQPYFIPFIVAVTAVITITLIIGGVKALIQAWRDR